ncbi:outer membrane beta-barrel protein [Fluviicola taffensis]|uniref:Outer membrane protein beta-barrel domain-containing protein n=1 Tax=Fluviicola taffensis (strain DSM 16823 / NCIMB 13979 / RW262) TaxID=755732 RepID=F2IHY5_FLUTR|nr:outer membrane beta-barrel protein [Fluviicola taffensis]AEA45944.1 hypothetical protein Fluta_3981 [Fluviicola taffensis DSM 16823]
MKKLILPILSVFVIGSASAQFNIGLSVGYGLGNPRGTFDETKQTPTSEKNIYGTLGTGLQLNLTPGYMFGDHFGMELGLNGFLGSKTTVGQTTTAFGEYKHVQYSNQFRVSPMVVIKSGGEKFSVYAKAGFVIPLLGATKTEISNSTNPLTTQEIEAKTNGKISLGYTGAFGANIHFGKKFTLFAEVGANSIRVKSKKTEYTKFSVGGNDIIGNMTEYGKSINYVDELTSSSNTSSNPNVDTNKPEDQLRKVANFSNFFVQVGFKITFGE